VEGKSFLKEIYKDLRSSFLVIGLTGRLGAGVSTTAERINEVFVDTEETQKFLSCVKCCDWLKQIDKYEQLRARRLEKFWAGLNLVSNTNNYKPKILRVRLILLLLFRRIWDLWKDETIDKLLEFSKRKEKEPVKKLNNESKLRELMENLLFEISNLKIPDKLFNEDYRSLKSDEDISEIDNLLNVLETIDIEVRKGENNFLYIRFLQELGRILRSFEYCPKEIYKDREVLSCFTIAELCRRLISVYSKNGKYNIFIIDALRNNLEIEFFRNRYSNFYLFSILAQKDVRTQRLKQNGLKEEDIKRLMKIEEEKPKSEEELYEQNIEFCITKADIFIDNNINESGFSRLKYQLVKYLTLIIHPGLIPPTKDEIFMQIAISTRYASGCISRQVGAVVVGQDGYVRGIGWNDVPEGHVSCSLRDFDLFKEEKKYFSPYEREELAELYSNYKIKWKDELPFCFKDIQNFNELTKSVEKIKEKLTENAEFKEDLEKIVLKVFKEDKLEGGKKEEILNEVLNKIASKIPMTIRDYIKAKNPSRERALHAEENAYLQAAKVGGVSVKGGTLYTTDFPCQLCSKKTVQLQISRVVYIEDYPDISKEHTLQTNPKIRIDFFKGAVREAYFKLYAPFMPLKDEIEFYLNSQKEI